MIYLCSKTRIGKHKDSPCQDCIVKMLCDEPFGCWELSKYCTNKTTIIWYNHSDGYIEKEKLPTRRKPCMARFKTHVKSVLLKLTALLNGIVLQRITIFITSLGKNLMNMN
jgi:hypothetical protein